MLYACTYFINICDQLQVISTCPSLHIIKSWFLSTLLIDDPCKSLLSPGWLQRNEARILIYKYKIVTLCNCELIGLCFPVVQFFSAMLLQFKGSYGILSLFIWEFNVLRGESMFSQDMRGMVSTLCTKSTKKIISALNKLRVFFWGMLFIQGSSAVQWLSNVCSAQWKDLKFINRAVTF